MNDPLRFFASLTDAQLLTEVDTLAAIDRNHTVMLVASLAELDARQLYLGLGFSSIHKYCMQHLRLSEHAAYSRIEAARTARAFPVVLDLLNSGDLTLTTLALLGRHLTAENHLTLLEAARHKTKREVQAQIAEISPRPELDAEIYPLSAGRYRLEVTITTEAYETLRRLQDLMRHSVPTGDPAEIVMRSLTHQLQHVERQLLADVTRPRAGLRVSHTRYVPAAVKREVWRRDGFQCAFVGVTGRCMERGFLQLHHLVPFAEGGPTTAENLQLRCRAHNMYEVDRSAATKA